MGTWLEHVVVALGWQNKGSEYKETSFAWGKNIRSCAPLAATRRRCLPCRRFAGQFVSRGLPWLLSCWAGVHPWKAGNWPHSRVYRVSSLPAPQILGSGQRYGKHFVEAGTTVPLPLLPVGC